MINRRKLLVALTWLPLASAAGAPAAPPVPELPADAAIVQSIRGAKVPHDVVAEVSALGKMFAVDLTDAEQMARLTLDPQRPSIFALGIVNPAALKRVAAMSAPPIRDTELAIRYSLVVPVTDVVKAAEALEKMASTGEAANSCGRPGGPPAQWSTWLAQLGTEDDRKAARSAGAAYLCTSMGGLVARVNRTRREVSWVMALAIEDPIAAAVAPLPLAPELAIRLATVGFFSAGFALHSTPSDQARMVVAMSLTKAAASLQGVDPSIRPKWWRESVRESEAVVRIVESRPRLFTELVTTDKVTSYGLTTEGETFFSSLALPARVERRRLHAEIEKKLKPADAFATQRTLGQASAGPLAGPVVQTFMWPHFLAFLKANPLPPEAAQKMPWITAMMEASGAVELDRQTHRLRITRK